MADFLLNQRAQARLIFPHAFDELNALLTARLELVQDAVHRSLLLRPVLLLPLVVRFILPQLPALGLFDAREPLVELAGPLLRLLELISQLSNRAKLVLEGLLAVCKLVVELLFLRQQLSIELDLRYLHLSKPFYQAFVIRSELVRPLGRLGEAEVQLFHFLGMRRFQIIELPLQLRKPAILVLQRLPVLFVREL